MLFFGGGLAISLGIEGLHDIGLSLLKCSLSGILLRLLLCCLLRLIDTAYSLLFIISVRVRNSCLPSLFRLLRLSLSVIFHWHLLITILISLLLILSFGYFGRSTLCSCIIGLILIRLRTLHQFCFLLVLTLLRFHLRELIVWLFLFLSTFICSCAFLFTRLIRLAQ